MLYSPLFLRAALLGGHVVWAVAQAMAGDLSVHPLFGDGAVLQRDLPVKIWGSASPNSEVTLSFRAQTTKIKAEANGSWTAVLTPEPAGGPHSLQIKSDEEALEIKDVYVGEVWFASGQSNMQYRVRYMKAEDRLTIAQPDGAFRILNLRQRASDTPQAATHVNDRWLTVDEASIRDFSAVGFFFGHELRTHLNVPIGVIASSVGGTSIRSWLSTEGLTTLPAVKSKVDQAWEQTLSKFPTAQKSYEVTLAKWTGAKTIAEAAGQPFLEKPPRAPDGPNSHRRPYGLFNGMVAPVIPYTVRGVLWYQGESDAAEFSDIYGSLLVALMRDWRSRWGRPDMPFLFVQLPGYADGKNWATFRQQQTSALTEPATGMAVTIDLGEETNVHPRNKRPVGERLANLALRNVYHLPVHVDGPKPVRVAREGTAVRLNFVCEKGARLVFKPETSPSGFEIRNASGVFLPASVKMDGDTLVLSHPEIMAPAEIRYAWSAWPALSVFDSSQLPVAPFLAPVEILP
ncbi:MAG: Sialate O-acetylesterase [Rariglobus sp.]|jgi:sialate O-acetylesterase|nr:Sialate O-acetylesterase [Rariglobus sp.]